MKIQNIFYIFVSAKACTTHEQIKLNCDEIKKLFLIGLLMLLFVAMQVTVPDKAVTKYQDATIQLSTVPVQPLIVIPAVLDAENLIYAIAVRQGDVEKSSFSYFITYSQAGTSDKKPKEYNSMPGKISQQKSKDIDGRYRLDIGESYGLRV